MKIYFLIYLLAAFCLAGCGAGPAQGSDTEPKELIVFAAASLTDAFSDLADAFEAQHEGVEVVLNFAGSSQLAAQLSEGAVADLFAPANPIQMQVAMANGRVIPGSETNFASNHLSIIVPATNPAGIASLADVAQPGVQLILAVPGVPVRRYTDELVAALPADFQTNFYANLVSEEDNVRQVVAKIALGEADAGFVYLSDVTPDIASQVQQIEIPDGQNVVATYPIAPLANAPAPTLAIQFIEFVLSDAGQLILQRRGFAPAPNE